MLSIIAKDLGKGKMGKTDTNTTAKSRKPSGRVADSLYTYAVLYTRTETERETT